VKVLVHFSLLMRLADGSCSEFKLQLALLFLQKRKLKLELKTAS
jgi:hypothetical protein